MGDSLGTVLILGYTVWAIYSGWKFVSNKIPSLNEPGGLYLTGKIVLSVLIGYVIGAFTLLGLILGIFLIVFKKSQ